MNGFIVSKGWEGFADRLQSLSHCVTLAKKHNRVLCVDWSDRIWSHDGESFDTYFSLEGLPYLGDLHGPYVIPRQYATQPPFWFRGLGLCMDEWAYDIKHHLELKEDPDFPVWIHPGIGFRSYNIPELVSHLRLKPDVAKVVVATLGEIDPHRAILHLRGTDRKHDEDDLARMKIECPDAIILTDDFDLAEDWLRDCPRSTLLSRTMVGAGIGGGHKLHPGDLSKAGYTKHQMNLALITDFMILANAKKAKALNEESLFFQIARLVGDCGGVGLLIGNI